MPGSAMEWYSDPNASSGGVWGSANEDSVETEKVGDGVADEDAYCGTKWTCFPGIVVVIWDSGLVGLLFSSSFPTAVICVFDR